MRVGQASHHRAGFAYSVTFPHMVKRWLRRHYALIRKRKRKRKRKKKIEQYNHHQKQQAGRCSRERERERAGLGWAFFSSLFSPITATIFTSTTLPSSSSSSNQSLGFPSLSLLRPKTSETRNLQRFGAKTGALCCVAAGPHGANPNSEIRSYSMVPGEPQWRTNSSFSPPPRRWDCRFQSDGLHGYPGASQPGSSLSSYSKRSRSRVNKDHYPKHHHSMSDGVVSYIKSPDGLQPPRRTPPLLEPKSDEFSTCVGGSKWDNILFPLSDERKLQTGGPRYLSFGSPSISESSELESTTKQHSSSHRNFSDKRSFMFKPVYPLWFRNPISDRDEAFGSASTSSTSKVVPAELVELQSDWPDNSSHRELKFYKTVREFHKKDASPDPSMSFRREGFRWSNASSYDLGFDGEGFDVMENVSSIEDLRSPSDLADNHKCGLCNRLMCQKSPWSSYRLVRGSDMPIAAVLSCSHNFHAECLEQATPKTQVHDPPCPLCSKTAGVSVESPFLSEPLQTSLRSFRGHRRIVFSDTSDMNDFDLTHETESSSMQLRTAPLPQRHGGSASLKNLKKSFTFRGKSRKDIFCSKIFCKSTTSSSNHDPGECSTSGRSFRK